MTDSEVVDAELLTPTEQNALDIQERANIDLQIQTAKAYPRSMKVFKEKAIECATFDDETAESCIYRRPVGKDKNGRPTFAEGLSVRMAEIVGSKYGNLRVAARIIEQTPTYVKAQGVAHDLESNFFCSSEVIESTVDRNGKPYNDRMRVVIAKAALAKARRDATFQVVPRALAKPIEVAVRELLFGNTQSLSKRRENVRAWIKKLGIDEERVYNALDVKGVEDMGEKELELLTGIKTSIKNRDTSIDDAFPPIKKNAFERALEHKQEEPENTSSSFVSSASVSSGNVSSSFVSSGTTPVSSATITSGGSAVQTENNEDVSSGGYSSNGTPLTEDEIALFK